MSNGNFQSSAAWCPRLYGWLGGKQRAADHLGGLVLMGVRHYDRVLGRFLQVDPVPGGSANDYGYADQDPVNGFDLDGRMRESASGDNVDGGCSASCMAASAHWNDRQAAEAQEEASLGLAGEGG